jgi:predicted phage-related endonuclease
MSLRRTIPKPTDRDEWLNARMPFIGGSEVSALLGRHPFLRASRLAAEKLDGTHAPDTPAMRRGRYFEAAIASMWSDDHGLALVEPELLYIYDDTLVATLDRIVVGTETILEIKTVRYPLDGPHEHWLDQAQVQLLTSGYEKVLIACFATMTDELVEFEILPDVERQRELYEAAVKFLAAIRSGDPLAGFTPDYDEVREQHPRPSIDRTELDDEALSWCSSLRLVQRRIHDLEVDEDRLKAMIGQRIGEAAEGWHDERLVATFRTTTRTGVDTKRLRAERPDVFTAFRTETTYRTLRLAVER